MAANGFAPAPPPNGLGAAPPNIAANGFATGGAPPGAAEGGGAAEAGAVEAEETGAAGAVVATAGVGPSHPLEPRTRMIVWPSSIE